MRDAEGAQLLAVRAQRGEGPAGPAPHLWRGVPGKERAVRPDGISLPRELPPVRAGGSPPEQADHGHAAPVRPEAGHGAAGLDGGRVCPGVRAQLSDRRGRDGAAGAGAGAAGYAPPAYPAGLPGYPGAG